MTGYHAFFAMTAGRHTPPAFFTYAFCHDEPLRSTARMILHAIMHAASWDQLERVWEFIVGFFKFLWALLKFLGGAG